MKKCSKCSKIKKDVEFHNDRRYAGGLHCWCKECKRNEFWKCHNRNSEYVWNIRVKSSCTICGEGDPRVLDFHHRDSRERRFSLSRGGTGTYSIKTIQKEIDKCDILCANCHRILHYESKKDRLR